jgi:Mg/Co/Ni transporter MgtE
MCCKIFRISASSSIKAMTFIGPWHLGQSRWVFGRELIMGLALGLALGLMTYFRVLSAGS